MTNQKSSLDNRAIGLRISRLRKRLGITIAELADKVGMSRAQISRLENGRQGFRTPTLLKISQALGVKTIYFFMADEDVSIAVADVIRKSGDLYGHDMPYDLNEALSSPRFKRFVSKSARIFLEDEAAFSKLSSLARKTKL